MIIKIIKLIFLENKVIFCTECGTIYSTTIEE